MKKNKFLLILAVASIMFNGNLLAEDTKDSPKERQLSLKTESTVEVGVQGYWYKYEEEVNGAYFMSNEGTKYGFSLTGIKTLSNDFYVVGDLRYATGDVKYNSASGTGDVTDNMYEARLMLGKDNIVDDSYLLSAYIGVGYRYLYNDLRDLGSGGYRRESKYQYIPVGVTHRFMLDNVSRVSTSIEYDYFLGGEQKSYLSDVSPSYAAAFGDPVNKQRFGYGLRINTAYEELHWSIGLFFNYWKIDDSEKNYYEVGSVWYVLTEPKNETQEIGVQLKYRF